MKRVCEVPKGEHQAYIHWLNTPGLTIPAGKTSVSYYLECTKKGQMKVSDYD